MQDTTYSLGDKRVEARGAQLHSRLMFKMIVLLVKPGHDNFRV